MSGVKIRLDSAIGSTISCRAADGGPGGPGDRSAISLPDETAGCFDSCVSRWRTAFQNWLPVALWAAVIFTASSDAGSSGRTSRFIRPLLLWLKPDLGDVALDRAQYAIRKGAHITEYALLTALLWRALRHRRPEALPSWDRRLAGRAFGLAVAFAASDELHQLFVPTREGRIRDVLYDSAGAALALLFLWAWQRSRHHRPSAADKHPLQLGSG